MVVGLGTLTLRLHECHSLKAKRKIVKSMIGRIRSHFNLSVAEVADNDRHGRAVIGFAMIGNDVALINSKLDKLINFADALGLAEIIDQDTEIFTV